MHTIIKRLLVLFLPLTTFQPSSILRARNVHLFIYFCARSMCDFFPLLLWFAHKFLPQFCRKKIVIFTCCNQGYASSTWVNVYLGINFAKWNKKNLQMDRWSCFIHLFHNFIWMRWSFDLKLLFLLLSTTKISTFSVNIKNHQKFSSISYRQPLSNIAASKFNSPMSALEVSLRPVKELVESSFGPFLTSSLYLFNAFNHFA